MNFYRLFQVKLVDIPKPDYSELRRSIPGHENTLDPRLRRILRIKEDPADSDTSSVSNTIKSPSYSSPNAYFDSDAVPPRPSKLLTDLPIPNTLSGSDAVCKPRIDPRRPNMQMTSSTVGAPVPATLASQQQQQQRPPQLGIQSILQKSNWYQNCSSKQKIMVNQQLAIVSTELKKYHADTSPNKIFDLTFVRQNQVLQDVLTHLGIYINDMGEFVQLSGPGAMGGNDGGIGNVAGSHNGMADLMSLPINQLHAMQQTMGGNNPSFNVPPPMMRFGPVGMPNDMMRPGLLGMAPNMPLPTPFNLFEHSGAPNNFDNFNNFNRGGNQQNNNMNRNNFGGNRWSGHANSGNNRNQFDNRGQSRRDKK